MFQAGPPHSHHDDDAFGLLNRSMSGSGKHVVFPYVPPLFGYGAPAGGLNGILNLSIS